MCGTWETPSSNTNEGGAASGLELRVMFLLGSALTPKHGRKNPQKAW